MYYYANELRLELPGLSSDRTLNVLGINDPQSQRPVQLVINRDLLIGGETLEQCFERQLNLLKREAQQFKLHQRLAIEAGSAKLKGIELESSFIISGKAHHQLQAIIELQAPKLLTLTMSAPGAVDESMRALWRKVLTSIEPWQPPRQ